MVDDMRASLIQPTYRVEKPDEVTASGAPSGKTVNVSETLIAHKYDGQPVLVTFDASGGGLEGTFLTVEENDTSSITFEETPPALASGDKLAIRTRGQPPQDAAGGINDYFGVFKSNELPDRIKEFFDGYYHGGNLPRPDEFIDVKNSYDASLSVNVKNAALLALGMGKVVEETTDYDGSDPADSLNSAAYPGSYRLDMGAVPDAQYAVGKILHVTGGTGGDAEVVKVSSIDGNFIVLVDPLKNYHADDAVVHLIKQTVSGVPDTVITHTISIAHGLPTFTLEAGFKRTEKFTAANDLVLQFLGLIVKSIECRSEPGTSPLELTMGVVGLTMRDETDAGTDLTTLSSKTEVGFDKGSYIPSRSKVTIDGTVYGEAEGFSIKMSRGIETVMTHNDGSRPNYQFGDPWDHYEGNVEMNFSVSIPMKNRNFIDMVKYNDTPFTTSFLYTRNTDETVKFTFSECRITQAKKEIPEEGKIPQSVEAKATNLEIEVKDFVPYYEV